MDLPTDYPELLRAVKERLSAARSRAALSVNSEMVRLYWDIGQLLDARQRVEGWGAAVIPRLAIDLRNDFPELKGFSERNLKRMITFFREYPPPPDGDAIVPQPVAQLHSNNRGELPERGADNAPVRTGPPTPAPEIVPQLVAQIPWGHNILLIEKVKDHAVRRWYMARILEHGWSRSTLKQMIETRAHQRQGAAITNFPQRMPANRSNLATQTIKDPYIFDFLTIDQPFREREVELGLLTHLERFLLELGQGFAFVGRQYHLVISDDDFYLDLLFYHLRLRCYVVIDLKVGPFKPEYAGKMNFYCNLVDDQLRHPDDHPTIGLILCQDRKHVVAEYALRGMDKPIGVSEYQLTRELPSELASTLPAIDAIEAALSGDTNEEGLES